MVSVAQIRGARGLLGWSQTALAASAGLSEPTIKRYETGSARVSEEAVAKMIATLESAGVEFTNGGQPGVRMRASSADKDSAISDEAALPEMPKKDAEPYDGSPV
jgi:transcriptional regulator with XRE-family HTH domain